MKKYILHFSDLSISNSLGLLILRIGVCLSLMTHGYGKVMNYETLSGKFMNHLSMGSEISLALVIFAEFFSAFFVLLGLGTRIFSIPIIYNFIIVVFIAHAADPFGKMEKGVLFLTIFLALILLGPGKYSIDYHLSKKFKN